MTASLPTLEYTPETVEVWEWRGNQLYCRTSQQTMLRDVTFWNCSAIDKKMIEAAPAMLAACKGLLERYLIMGCGEGPEALAAKAAIAKAEGRTLLPQERSA